MGRPPTATRERILNAALTRFSGYGFRRTSMEDIAGEAGVSRAALYLQFRNKEEIFRSLSAQLHEDALAQAAAALRADAPLVDRLVAAVEAKSLRFIEIAYGSPHGSELLDESNRLCGALPAEMERRFVERLTGVFRAAARTGAIDLAESGLTARDAAELFIRSVAGLKGPGVTAEVYRKRLAALARVFVTGLGGAHAAAPPEGSAGTTRAAPHRARRGGEHRRRGDAGRVLR